MTCNCNCHKIILHAPSCNKNNARTKKDLKKLKCTCDRKKPSKNSIRICSDCFKNHPDNPNYESMKFGAQLIGRILN